ncbi:MAG: enoyl-CoA hydratase/isomerase family protein [Dehalococcoidia bacterium]|nr:MAG: enoyl-CoA hydratase/isomerase family protein [Dehalococcoidia bacterium]
METITIERDDELPGLVTITLNRPEKLNAINARMHAEIQQACRDLADDGDARVVIVTGAGRAFSAGADLGGSTSDPNRPALASANAERSPLRERIRSSAGNRTCAALEGLDQVTIGAVNGLAIGGAVVFLACLDIRVAAESSWFSIPEVDLEIPLTWNALPRLMRELGPARTKELVMTCDRFSSEDALRWGFLNHRVPDAEILSRARDLARKLLDKDPVSLALTKSTCNALAESMVPAHVTHSDRDYLVLSRLLAEERKRE